MSSNAKAVARNTNQTARDCTALIILAALKRAFGTTR